VPRSRKTPAKTSCPPWLQFEFQWKARPLPRHGGAGEAVALIAAVPENKPTAERRVVGGDRRKNSRGGRRTADPHTDWRWRRLAWLFAAYAVYLSVRSLPATVKDYVSRWRTPTATS
jgi:hypothetical protein